MRRKKSIKNEMREARIAEGWQYLVEAKLEGKRYALVPGRELKIKGAQRGSIFRFKEMVVRPDGVAWVTVFGGPSGHGQWHSFDPERVTWISRRLPRAS